MFKLYQTVNFILEKSINKYLFYFLFFPFYFLFLLIFFRSFYNYQILLVLETLRHLDYLFHYQ